MSLYGSLLSNKKNSSPVAFSVNEKAGRRVQLSSMENFLLSGTAAVTSKTISAPIERIKMVVQNQAEMVKQGTLERPFNGITDCTRWILKNEGPAAFWKSNFTNCIRYFPTQALNFTVKPLAKQGMGFWKPTGYGGKLSKNVVSGGIAGSVSLTCVYSLDYARTRLANDMKSNKSGGSGREFNGLFDVYKKTIKADGVSGLYRGFGISCVGIFVYRGFYFGLYDTVTAAPQFQNLGLLGNFAIGYVVTVVAGLASYPIDTIRRRMMMTSGTGVHYSSSMDCARKILAAEGVKSFFKGAGANILRGVAGAGVLAGFDSLKGLYVRTTYGQDAYTK